MLTRLAASPVRVWIIGGIALAATAGLALAVAMWVDPGLRERITGDTVEAKIDAYLQAVMRDDREAALEAWPLDGTPANVEGWMVRRETLTSDLIARDITGYYIEGIEWWRNCCEPGVIDGPRNAGLGRAVVWLQGMGPREAVVFDVLTRTTYWGDAAGSPPHEWRLRDVYLASEKPFYVGFAQIDRWHPQVRVAVEAYFDRYAGALVACDAEGFLAHYPGLATGADLSRGINGEVTRIQRCSGLKSLGYELERYAPMRLHGHANWIDVTVHGLERWDYGDSVPGGGEFIVTLRLKPTAGIWEVVRTDEVTLPEYHERH